MKPFITITRNISFCWLCLMLCLFQINAQDCEVDGVPLYALSITSFPVKCYNGNSGTAIVASTGCPCMFTECIFEWMDSDGQMIQNPEGTGPLNSHNVEGLSVGDYTAIITHEDGCVMEISVTVEDTLESFIQDIIVQPVKCLGEANASITVIPTPENFNELTYEWSTGEESASIQNLGPGEYTVVVTDFSDANCQITETFVIEDVANGELECAYEVQPSCGGQGNGEIELFATGGQAPYAYRIGNQPFQNQAAFTGLVANDYEVTMKDANGCTTSIIIEIQDGELDMPVINSGALQICKGQMTNLQAFTSSNNISYHWSPEETISNPNSNFVIANPEVTTTYTLMIANEAECQRSVDVTIEVEECNEVLAGLDDVKEGNIQLYPNPVVDYLNVQINSNTSFQLTVFDLNGRKVVQRELKSSDQISFEGFHKGIYIIVLENEEGQYFSKIVKD